MASVEIDRESIARTQELIRRHVRAASGDNHGIAVAYAAMRLGKPAHMRREALPLIRWRLGE